MERDFVNRGDLFVLGDFNSRAHVERDLSIKPKTSLLKSISTHALTWSATMSIHFAVTRVSKFQ